MNFLVSYCLNNQNKPNHNEYGIPLNACNGYRQDEHYWVYLKFKRESEGWDG